MFRFWSGFCSQNILVLIYVLLEITTRHCILLQGSNNVNTMYVGFILRKYIGTREMFYTYRYLPFYIHPSFFILHRNVRPSLHNFFSFFSFFFFVVLFFSPCSLLFLSENEIFLSRLIKLGLPVISIKLFAC